MQLRLSELSVILEINPYVISSDFFSMKELPQQLQIFKAYQQRIILYSEFTLILSIWIAMYNGYFLFWPSISLAHHKWTRQKIFFDHPIFCHLQKIASAMISNLLNASCY